MIQRSVFAVVPGRRTAWSLASRHLPCYRRDGVTRLNCQRVSKGVKAETQQTCNKAVGSARHWMTNATKGDSEQEMERSPPSLVARAKQCKCNNATATSTQHALQTEWNRLHVCMRVLQKVTARNIPLGLVASFLFGWLSN